MNYFNVNILAQVWLKTFWHFKRLSNYEKNNYVNDGSCDIYRSDRSGPSNSSACSRCQHNVRVDGHGCGWTSGCQTIHPLNFNFKRVDHAKDLVFCVIFFQLENLQSLANVFQNAKSDFNALLRGFQSRANLPP
jgi:hypothetical protein